MATYSSDDESAEMERVRERLRKEHSLMLSSPLHESGIASSETSESSMSFFKSATSNKFSQGDPTLRVSGKAYQGTANQAALNNAKSPLYGNKKTSEKCHSITPHDGHYSRCNVEKEIPDLKRDYPSFVPPKPNPFEEQHFEDSFGFLDNCEALDELDRQIEASIQAKAETKRVPASDVGLMADRLKKSAPVMYQRSIGKKGAQSFKMSNGDKYQISDDAASQFDRQVQATKGNNLSSYKILSETSKSITGSTLNNKQNECKTMKKNSLIILHNTEDFHTTGNRDDSTNPKERKTEFRPRQMSSRKRRLKEYDNVGPACLNTGKKQTKDVYSTFKTIMCPANEQQCNEDTKLGTEKSFSIAKNDSTLRQFSRPSQVGKNFDGDRVTQHRDIPEKTDNTDSSSEDSFGFFDKKEKIMIEERTRSQYQKRMSLAMMYRPMTSIASDRKTLDGAIAIDSSGDTNDNLLSPHDEECTDTEQPLQSPSRNNSSIELVEIDFDKAFGFQDAAAGQHSDRSDSNNFTDTAGLSLKNNLTCLLERPSTDKSLSDFQDGIEADDRLSEIDPNVYAPDTPERIQPPIVHRFSLENRPLGIRRKLLVDQVFPKPISTLWKTKFTAFNHLQSELANILAYSDDNLVVSAPTGAGKTALFEMAMARFFLTNLQRQSRKLDGHHQVDSSQKIVYICPSKALCDERYEDWSATLGSMNIGIQVALITGDGDPSAAFRDFTHGNLILTTPEKWDSLSRRWTESFFLFATVKLLLVDEVHLVADESRGWCLESVICRMKTIQRAAQKICVTQAELQHSSYSKTTPEAINAIMRTIAVSATLPNLGDIATFVGANEAHTFDDSYRPVPLTVHVIGQGFVGDGSTDQYRFWSGLDRSIPELIHRFSKKKPSLIFCHSKADTEKLAELLAIEPGIGFRSDTNANMAGQTKVDKLQKALFYGLAYHHAGLDTQDRRLVEQFFSEGKIRVLCATSTLAMGVNLPAHLVVIKGTKAWRGGRGYSDLDQATLLQMIGRAGRPGFDCAGTAIVMTDNRSKSKFEKLASEGLDFAVSKLYTKLDEIINAEVSQKVIFSTESAINWIKTSLFCAQLFRHPALFGQVDTSIEKSEEHLWRLCNESIQRLKAIGTLTTFNGQQVFALPASHVMSYNLVEYQAIKQFNEIPYDATQHGLLVAVSKIQGMHRPVRRSEKRALKAIHKQLKYKLDGPLSRVTIQQPSEKVFVLIQASLMNLAIEDQTLRQEMNMVTEFSSRMLSALEDFSVRSTRNGIVALRCMRLRRALATKCWVPTEGMLHQIPGVDQTTAANLKMAGANDFNDVMELNNEDIEKAAERSPDFGQQLKDAVEQMLKGAMTLKVHFDSLEAMAVCIIERRSTVTIDSESKASVKGITYSLLAYSDHRGKCILYRRNLTSPCTYKIKVEKGIQRLTFHLIASIIGLDEKTELNVLEQAKILGNDLSFQIGTVLNQNSYISSEQMSREARVQSTRNEIFVHKKESQRLVTPSPKLGGRIIESSNTSNVRQPSMHMKITDDARATWATPFQAHQIVTPNDSEYYFREAVTREEYNDSMFRGTMENRSVKVPLEAFHGSNKRVFEEMGTNSPFNGINRTKSQTAWNREKLQQHRTQQRAFVRKKDNPFSDFKCDPNNVEDILDSLSSMNSPRTRQVIPVEGIRALENAYLGSTESQIMSYPRSDSMISKRLNNNETLGLVSDVGLMTRQTELGDFRENRTSVGSVCDQAKEYMGMYCSEDTSLNNKSNFYSWEDRMVHSYPYPAFSNDASVFAQYPIAHVHTDNQLANANIHNCFASTNCHTILQNAREGNFDYLTAYNEFQRPYQHHNG